MPRLFDAVAKPLLCLLVIAGGASAIQAATPMQATSGRSARDEAVRSIPYDRLSPDDRERVSSTISSTSLYRRLPVTVTECDPDLYLFLVRHPDVVVGIWETMSISNVAMERTGANTFRARDNAGTLCQVRYCYSNHDTQVIYAEGMYDGPLLTRPVKARCVLVLKSGYMQEPGGRHHITSRMDAFIAIENAGVDILAKTLQPLVNRSADTNFTETAAFVGALSKATETNPGGIQRLAGRLSSVDPRIRDEFAEVSLAASQKAHIAEAQQVSAKSARRPANSRPVPERR